MGLDAADQHPARGVGSDPRWPADTAGARAKWALAIEAGESAEAGEAARATHWICENAQAGNKDSALIVTSQSELRLHLAKFFGES